MITKISLRAATTCLVITAWTQSSARPGPETLQIEAGRVEILDKSHQAIFTGGIIGRQGEMTVAADTATANYTGGVFGGSTTPELTKIYARGHVTITRPSEKATGNFAVYDLKARKIVMIGDVALQRPSGFVRGGAVYPSILDSNLAVLSSFADKCNAIRLGRM